jgi:hypothetical protein
MQGGLPGVADQPELFSMASLWQSLGLTGMTSLPMPSPGIRPAKTALVDTGDIISLIPFS